MLENIFADQDFVEEIHRRLTENAEEEYRKYTARTVSNVPLEKIIGVRAPILQKIAKSIDPKSEEAAQFFSRAPHEYYEENVLHAYVISELEAPDDYAFCLSEIEKFLPHVDNWAVCDTLAPKLFSKHPKGLEAWLCDRLRAEHPYTVRFAIVTLMKFYLDEYFDEEHFQWLIDVSSPDQHVKAALAWYFSTALAKRYEQTVPLFENEMLEPSVHALSLQKAVQSQKIPYERKKYLRTLR